MDLGQFCKGYWEKLFHLLLAPALNHRFINTEYIWELVSQNLGSSKQKLINVGESVGSPEISESCTGMEHSASAACVNSISLSLTLNISIKLPVLFTTRGNVLDAVVWGSSSSCLSVECSVCPWKYTVLGGWGEIQTIQMSVFGISLVIVHFFFLTLG